MKATLDADFSTFQAEAAKAEAELGKLAQSAEAADKSLGGMASAQNTSASSTNSAVTSLRQFDGVLAAVGVNINSQIRAVDELAAAAGKTAGQIGALGTAGLVVGTAFAGWETGRAIAGFFGLDEKVSHLTTSLFGLNDVQKQTALAQQDTIDKASALAGRTLSYAEAVDFLNQRHKEAIAAQKAYEEGTRAITEAGENWLANLDTIDGSVVEAIKLYIDLGVSQKDIAAAYGLTAAQVRAVVEARKVDMESMKLQQEMDKTTFELAQQHQRQWRDEIAKTAAERNKSVIEGLGQIRKAESDLSDFIAKNTLSTTDYEIKKLWEVVAEQEAAFKGSEEQRKVFNANVEALANESAERLKQTARDVAQAAVQAEIDAVNALNAIIPNIGHGPTTPNNQGPSPIVVPPIVVPSVFHGRASGGPVSAGQSYLVGENEPEIYTPGANGFITPFGGGGTTNVTIYVNGTAEEVARKVADEILRRVSAGQKLRQN